MATQGATDSTDNAGDRLLGHESSNIIDEGHTKKRWSIRTMGTFWRAKKLTDVKGTALLPITLKPMAAADDSSPQENSCQVCLIEDSPFRLLKVRVIKLLWD
ncbi:hypothetical protein BaRGS_00020303 [Batillaria attramentaria]|uniref:Uncharacterized protein n=1 Tax=Batillaria attramentaria TaxID=370345 RepID=A0ABD0KNN0_9CAEN